MHRLFGAYLGLSGSSRILDKYPEHIFRIPFVKSIFPDAKFIFIVRDGRDTSLSVGRWCKKHTQHYKDETHDWWGINKRKWHIMVDELVKSDPEFKSIWDVVDTIQSNTDMAAVEWMVTMKEGFKQSSLYPESFYTLKFEDLVLEPQKYLKEITEFCELRHDNVFLSYAKEHLLPLPPKPSLELNDGLVTPFNEMIKHTGYSL